MSRVAIVTGGAGTLGSAITEELVKQGHRVVVAYRSRALEADNLVERLGGASFASSVHADLALPEAAKTIVDAANDVFGVPTVLVNNAGIMTSATVESMSDDQWDESITVNLTSAFRLAREVIPGMRAEGSGGRIINISSQAAFRGSAGRAHYAAAKAGMLGLTYSLARTRTRRDHRERGRAGTVHERHVSGASDREGGGMARRHTARPVRHTGRTRQCGGLLRLRRRLVHHGRHAASGRWSRDGLTDSRHFRPNHPMNSMRSNQLRRAR